MPAGSSRKCPNVKPVGVAGDPQQRPPEGELPLISAEPSYLYSSRSFWYPQAVVTDYATARIRLSVPATYEAVGSGQLEPGFPSLIAGKDGNTEPKAVCLRRVAAAALPGLRGQQVRARRNRDDRLSRSADRARWKAFRWPGCRIAA
jgi:hypothetical protein